jgi:hypothetical protein
MVRVVVVKVRMRFEVGMRNCCGTRDWSRRDVNGGGRRAL